MKITGSELRKKLDRLLLTVQKPAQYIGGELNSVIKDASKVDIRFAFCFPDTYEIGMSHLGMKILYTLLNNREDTWCERVFAPWIDFEQVMRENGIPLYALESLDPLTDFDVIGFTLQYELSFTNVLNMLDLAGIPLLSKERDELTPLIVAGGPCACNPEPIADFIDLFMLGEGEEVMNELMDLFKECKLSGIGKKEFLCRAAQIEGVYVPSLYTVTYKEDSTIEAITPDEGIPAVVHKRIIDDFDKVLYPDNFVVPYVGTVHDRAVLEIMRGCIRGCRFCQAGYIYRPLREKNADTLCRQGKSLCDTTGYEELSLSSLSTSDYSKIEKLLNDMLDYSKEEKVSFSMPSMRIDNFSEELLEKISAVRKSGLTFAPEAGTQRMRDVINKNITEEDIFKSCLLAFAGGYSSVKLYFMLGLPTETLEDVAGIIELAKRIVDAYYKMENRQKKPVQVTVSVSTFVPKPHTPFQWEAQDTLETIKEKQHHLVHTNTSKRINVKYHLSYTSVLEGIFARGDRRLGEVMLKAFQKGCHFDSWDECFDYSKWMEAMEECGLDPAFYANRVRDLNEVLPWSHLDYGISAEFLKREHDKAYAAVTTPNCRQQCAGCGVNKLMGGGKCVVVSDPYSI